MKEELPLWAYPIMLLVGGFLYWCTSSSITDAKVISDIADHELTNVVLTGGYAWCGRGAARSVAFTAVRHTTSVEGVACCRFSEKCAVRIDKP